jgi:excisionase family DNA binding protein
MDNKLAYTIAEVCDLTSIGRTTLYEMMNSGQLVTRNVGKRVLILDSDLQKCLEALPIASPNEGG